MATPPTTRTDETRERAVLVFLFVFLGANAFFNAFFGFSLLLFLGTVPLSAALVFFFPRAGLVAALLLIIFFERFFTLQATWIGDVAYKLYPLDIILAAAFLGTVLTVLAERIRRPVFRAADGFLLAFFALVTGVFLVSFFGLSEVSGAVAFSTWKNYVFYGLTVFITLFLLRTREELLAFVRLLLFGIMAAGVFLVVGILRGQGLWTEYTPLSTAGLRLLAFPHAFYFSMALLALLLSLPQWWERVSERRRTIVSLFMLFLFFGVIGSLMRHLWLGLAGALVVALLLSPYLFGRSLTFFLARFVFPTLIVLVGAWYFLVLFPGSEPAQSVLENTRVFSERLSSIGDSYDESFAWRGEVWDSALERFRERPLFGIGFGVSVPVELGGYREYVEVRNMHNSWLALLIQTGVAGCLLLGLFLLSLLVVSAKRSFDMLGCSIRFVLLGLLAFQGFVFFSQPYLETNLLGIFFWLSLGLLRALVDIPDTPTAPAQRSPVDSRPVYG